MCAAGRVIDHHRLTIEEEVLGRCVVGVVDRQRDDGVQAKAAARPAGRRRRDHSLLHRLMRHDANGLRRAGAPLLDERLVAAGVIGVDVRVDDRVNRLGGQRPNRRNHLWCDCSRRRIHQQHAIVANLHGDVHAVDHQHVHAALDVQQADGRRRVLLPGLHQGCRNGERECDDREHCEARDLHACSGHGPVTERQPPNPTQLQYRSHRSFGL